MEMNKEIDRLRRQLQWEGAGPLAGLSNQMTMTLLGGLRAFVDWLREAGTERPLISLVLAMQAGFVVGRWGHRRAKH